MPHNTEPKWRPLTVKPRSITNWDRHTIETLEARLSQLEREVSTWSSCDSPQRLAVLTEHLAIVDLIESLKAGCEIEVH
jgi:molybdopterin converting factor small subunit